MQKSGFSLNFGETVFALAGLLILASALLIYFRGDFILWNIAKILYGLGLIIILRHA